MFRDDAAPPRCRVCGFVIDHSWIDPFFTLIPGRTPDASYTFDGCLIVSERFRAAARRFIGGSYSALPSQKGWYAMTASDQLAFDTERRRTRFEKWCDGCQRWTQVAGATPVFLRDPPAPLPDQFFRTDVEFGSGDELAPLILVGPGLAHVLTAGRLTGLTLSAIDWTQKIPS